MDKQNEFFNFDSPVVSIDKYSYNKAIDDVRKLISERMRRKCDFNSCDDCEGCCEIEALMWIEERLN